MRSSWALYLIVALVAAVAGMGVSWFLAEDPNTTNAADGPQSLLGQPRPPFSLGASDGRIVSAADFDGDVVLINFWATWCTPCRKEMPMLVELQNQWRDDGLHVIGIALDDVQRAKEFAERLGVNYTILVGAGDVMSVGLAYGNRAGLLPYSVLIDREGVVRWVHLGELKKPELEQQVQALL